MEADSLDDLGTLKKNQSGFPFMDVPCPVCNNQQSALYLDGDDNEIRLASVGSSRTLLSHGRILRCSSCGLAYRSFRPRSEELGRLYRAADDSRYEAEMPNRWRTARRHKRIIDRYVPSKGSLLDVGCASGAFLRVMQDAGWARGWDRAVGIAIFACKQTSRWFFKPSAMHAAGCIARKGL